MNIWHRFKIILTIVLVSMLVSFTIQIGYAQQWLNYTNSDHITSIDVAFNGDLWIGLRGGVIHYNIQTGEKTKYTVAEGLILNDVAAVAVSPSGTVLAGGRWGWGLSKFEGNNWSKYPISYSNLGNAPLYGGNISDMEFDHTGALWLAAEGEFSAAMLQNGTWTTLRMGGQSSSVAVRKNEIWFGTYSNGLLEYKSGTLKVLESPSIYDLAVDSSGNVWCATWGSGIRIFNGTSWDSIQTTNSNAPSNEVTKIVFDKGNYAWAVFYLDKSEILGRYDGTSWELFNSTNSPLSSSVFISCLASDTGDVLYVGTAPLLDACNGILYKGGGVIYRYAHGAWDSISVSSPGLPYPAVQTITSDGIGTMWFGTLFNGLTKFDGKSWATYNTSNVPFYKSNNVRILAVNKNGDIWAFGGGYGVSSATCGGSNPGGLVNFNGISWKVYDAKDSLITNFYVSDISAMAWNNDNNIWFGTSSKGVLKYDGTNWSHFDSTDIEFGMNLINKIKTDADGQVWFFGSKVVKYNGSSFSTVLNAIPFSDVKGIDVANDGTIWIVTQTPGWVYFQVRKFNGASWNSFENTSSDDGGGVVSFAVDNSGKAWIGMYGGGVWSFNGTTFTNYNGKNSGLGYEFITSIFVDSHNTKYFGGQDYGGGVSLYNENGITDIKDDKRLDISPSAYLLQQNFPNPFNPSTTIRYKVPISGHVKLTLFNTIGQFVDKLVDEYKNPGSYEVHWNPSLPSGVYFYRLQSGAFSETKKLILLR